MRLRRSLFAAAAALALTAGAVLGHEMPDASAQGQASAMGHSEKLLPVGQVADNHPTDPGVEQQGDGNEHCLDWSDGVPEVEEGDEPNHGAYVCGAAHADWETEGFAGLFDVDGDVHNKGAWVHWVAQRNYEEDETGATTTVESETGGGKANGHDRGRGRSDH